MKLTHMKHNEQHGFVSIFTVLMFAVLMSVVMVGFARVMLDEQQQTLQDDLSKSAYNSAQAGIEDAKRAMMYCSKADNFGTIPEQEACSDELYGLGSDTCPGFNRNAYFTRIGIPQANAAGERGTSVGGASQNQGYSCVIVSKDTPSLTGNLTVNAEEDTHMFELNTTRPFSYLNIDWDHKQKDSSALGALQRASKFGDGNPQSTPDGWKGAPGVIRMTLIAMKPSEPPVLTSTFIYPTDGTAIATYAGVGPFAQKRGTTGCLIARDSEYNCSVKLDSFDTTGATKYYLLIKSLYNSTSYRVTSEPDIKFLNVLPSIDATGFASDIYRRVVVRVHPGTNPSSLNALDAGQGICKDFLLEAGGSFREDICRQP